MRNIKKTAAILMLTAFIFAAVSPALAGGLAKITDIAGGNGGMAVGEKSTIYFGSYWQTLKSGAASGSTNLNDYNKEGIKWRVLSNADGKTLLLSDQGLYADQFNSESMGNVWRDSEIRATLNNTTAGKGFAGDAFSAAELAAIAETTHIAGGREKYAGYDTETTDKIFLLSDEEANNTAYGFENTEIEEPRAARQMSATEMAQHVAVYGHEGVASVDDGFSIWWLRSPGHNSKYAYVTYYYGETGDIYVHDGDYVLRPAFNLKQETVMLLSAATGGKSAVKLGDGFALEDYDGANGWKLTLKDTNIPTPKITNVETKDNKLQVTYSGVTTGKNMYLSALLYNETGELINYAKVAEKGDGTAEISLDGIEGKYKVRFFTEQANGDKQTDYASELSEEYEITAEKPKSSSGGCNAGFGALALLALAGLVRRKRS